MPLIVAAQSKLKEVRMDKKLEASEDKDLPSNPNHHDAINLTHQRTSLCDSLRPSQGDRRKG